MINFPDLTTLDFEILDYVDKHGSVSVEQISTALLKDINATKLRVEKLSERDIGLPLGFPAALEDTAYLDVDFDTQLITISRLGIAALEDWKQNKSDRFWEIRLCGYLTLIASIASFVLALCNTLMSR